MDAAQILDHYRQEYGIFLPPDAVFAEDAWKRDWRLAEDAQPTLITTSNAGIPSYLANIIDPNILRILTAKNKAALIMGEVRKGDWTMKTTTFPVVEQTGEVSSYGDFNNNGRAGANTNFPQRESYLYQTTPEYGELELDTAGLAKINWASEVREAAVTVLNKFQNLTYFRGVLGLQNYGLQNDPSLSAPITPVLKAWGGVTWFNGNTIAATANEIYADIDALFTLLVTQSAGNIDQESELVLALSPKSATALTATNTFNVNVNDLLKKNFPQLRIESAIQYGVNSTQNPQGIAAGELMQMIGPKVEGQDTGFMAFNEKLRAHKVIQAESSYRQKMTQGTWGCVLRQPFAISQMLGI